MMLRRSTLLLLLSGVQALLPLNFVYTNAPLGNPNQVAEFEDSVREAFQQAATLAQRTQNVQADNRLFQRYFPPEDLQDDGTFTESYRDQIIGAGTYT
jgi:hypothetical protein